jgi:hypothetical protein
MRDGAQVLSEFRAWFDNHRTALAHSGYHAEFIESPSDRDKQSASVTIVSSRRVGQLVIWDTGEAELSMGDVGSAAIMEEHREITSGIGLRDATETLVAWLADSP